MSLCVSDPTRQSVPATVENIADAVTHARFVGTDQASDGVVLMKILQVVVVAININNYCNFDTLNIKLNLSLCLIEHLSAILS
jgi:hypothetical protein